MQPGNDNYNPPGIQPDNSYNRSDSESDNNDNYDPPGIQPDNDNYPNTENNIFN